MNVTIVLQNMYFITVNGFNKLGFFLVCVCYDTASFDSSLKGHQWVTGLGFIQEALIENGDIIFHAFGGCLGNFLSQQFGNDVK
jgi:hypothetical protein